MHRSESTSSLTMGIASGVLIAILSAAYAFVLLVGLATLPTPEHPVQNPWFTIMELLILAIAPTMVIFAVTLLSWVENANKPFAVLGVVFMSLCAVVTCSVHFSVLTLGRHPSLASTEWAPFIFGFAWPSLSYALDILAWDLFFPLAALFSALALRGEVKHRHAQLLLFASALTAFSGLVGVPLESMNIRNIGIIGYVLLFPAATALIAYRLWSVQGRADHPLQTPRPEGSQLKR